MSRDPSTLKFTKTHEWVAVEGDVVTIGLTDFAVNALTDLVYVDLPEVGRKLEAGEAFGEVESVKAVSDLYSPVAGEVVEVNEEIADKLDVLSKDPFGDDSWLVKVRVTDASGLDELMDEPAYRAHCEAEAE